MPRSRTGGRIGRAVAAAAMVAAIGPARADQLTIRGGGTLRGEIVPVEGRPDQVEVYTATNPRPYSFRRDQIAEVVPENGPLDDYLARRDAIEPSAEARYQFGLWCEEQGLTGPALVEFGRAVALDEGHAEAQKKLGRVFFDGQWMTHDERRELQGLVKHDGRWITPEQKDDLDAMARQSEAQEAWGRRIDLLVKKATEGSPLERAEAASQLRQVADPEAVIPMVNRLGREGPELRLLLAEVLGGIGDPIASAGLAHRVVKESDPQVRLTTLNELARRQDPEVIPRLIGELKNPDPEHVGRAAWALAGLGAVEAVPKLVPALLSTQRRVETVLVPGPTTGGGMGFGVNFGSATGPAYGFGGGPSIPVLTGPAVAPGAIAFGVQAVPIYQYTGQGAGLTVGGGGGVAQGPPVPRQVVRAYRHRNVEVLAALERLTGENFGYEVEVWNRWLRTQFRSPVAEERPERRVPQP